MTEAERIYGIVSQGLNLHFGGYKVSKNILPDRSDIIFLRDRNDGDTSGLSFLGSNFGGYKRTDNGRHPFFI